MSLLTAIQNPLEFAAPDGIADADDMAVINGRASVPMTPDNVFVVPVVMANRNVSSYCIRMGDSTLRNCAQDAARGVAVHVMHEREDRNIGNTFAGFFDETTGEARAAEFLIRGRVLQTNDGPYNINAEIQDIQQGIRKYVSIGPSGAYYSHICELCGKDIYGWFSAPDDEEPCWHIPGAIYDGAYCVATLENARLMENSHVDAGAIPGAVIGRAATGEGSARIIRPSDFADAPPGPDTSDGFTPPGGVPARMPMEFLQGGAYGGFANKAVMMFRTSHLPKADFRQWLDAQQLADVTRATNAPMTPAQPRPQPNAGNTSPNPTNAPQTAPGASGAAKEQKTMKELAAALAALGISIPAQFLDGNVQQCAQAIAGIVQDARKSAETAAQPNAEQTELLQACATQGIKTPAELATLGERAGHGVTYATQVDTDLKAQLNRVFGETGPAKFEAAYSKLPIADKAELAKTFKEQADAKIGVTPGGNPPRVSAPTTYAYGIALGAGAGPGGETPNDPPAKPVADGYAQANKERAEKKNALTV